MTDDEVWTEDLAQPQRRRYVRVLLALLVLAAAGAVGLRLAGSHGGHRQGAPPAVRIHLPSEPALRTQPLEFRRPPQCPRATDGQVACNTYTDVPPGIRRAVRGIDPAVVIDAVVTQMLRPTGPEAVHGLWSREITGHAGRLQVRIAVTRRDGADRAGPDAVSTGVSRGYLLARRDQGRYTVQIMLRAAAVPGAARLASEVAELAADHRLVRPEVAPRGTMAG
jgi:hypothetical protein